MDQGGGFERGPKVCGGVSLSTRDVQKPLFLKGANDAEEKQKKKHFFLFICLISPQMFSKLMYFACFC